MSLDQKLSIWHIFPEKSRHDNGGNGSAGVSRVLSFLGEAAGGSLPVLPGLVLLLCAGELSGSAGNGNPV